MIFPTDATRERLVTTCASLGNRTQDKGNGRGILVVGNVVCLTVANSGNVFIRDKDTNADPGVACTIAGASGLQAISYDGTNFWVGDYSGTNKAYDVDGTTGAPIRTITLANAQRFYDGLEYFNGKLVANRFDRRFGGTRIDNVHDLESNLPQAAFITTAGHGNATGIAFDGTNLYVSNTFNPAGKISIRSGTTGAFIGNLDRAGNHGATEDLSFGFAAWQDTCGGSNQPPWEGGGGKVPEPGTLSIAALALIAAGGVARRRPEPR